MAFVHLHNHSEYSLLDGMTHIRDMVARAGELGQNAIAITDHGVMSGVVELADACDAYEKETGKRIKPIFGCEIYFTDDETLSEEHRPRLYHLILLAKNAEGYHNLVRLVSESHTDNFYYKPRTTYSQLQRYGKGLIGMSACLAGIIPRLLDEGRRADAVAWARRFASCFDEGDFYIELQNQGLRTDGGHTQVQLNRELASIARECGLKCVATNDFHYLRRQDASAQDIILCIGTRSLLNDEDRLRFANDQFYMKTEDEMREALREFPESCDNTQEVADKCNVELERDIILPAFPLPAGETEESWFKKSVMAGLERRYGNPVPQEVLDRANYEMDVIIGQGFPAYFLIVQEYINWARSQGIVVGPGRGSAAGAIVSYALGITDLDPIAHGLLFERFLSPERKELPDIDVDFEEARRGEVIDHIKDVYGQDRVAGVITFSTLQAKNAVRDVARVMNFPYSLGDRICKLIGTEIGITIDAALQKNPDLANLYKTDPNAKTVIDSAKSIEGYLRGEGVHACANIICRDALVEHIPMKRDTKGGGIITQYDGHYIPELGLLKMDFLGLRTLGVISRACRNIEKRTGKHIDIEDIPLDDEGAFELMRSGNMDGLFQVESNLYVRLFRRYPPKRFSDIVASIALNRPGPLESGMVDDYVKVASGAASIHYYDDRLRPILEETYGTIVYQEQIMQISMAMCGFSAGKADRLRKAMGKKNIDVMRSLREDWNSGAVEHGFSLEVARKIWDDAEKFAKYAFNKSHSAAYAILVMRTAYLKAHFPYDYMAAVLSSHIGNMKKLIFCIASCNHNGTPVLPPDINASDVEFTPVDEGIRFGLSGVRGVGDAVACAIIKERARGGAYKSLHDFVDRVDYSLWNRRTLEALIKAGAFDSLGYTRRQLMHFVDDTTLMEDAAKRQRDLDIGQMSMLDMFASPEDVGFADETPAPDGVEWDKRQLLHYEKEMLGAYVSEHPLDPYADGIARISKYRLGDLDDVQTDIKNAVFVGMVSNVKPQATKKGTMMARFTLEDTSGLADCIVFDYDSCRNILVEDAIVEVKGRYEVSDFGNQITAFSVEELEIDSAAGSVGDNSVQADNGAKREAVASTHAGPVKLELRLKAEELKSDTASRLKNILHSYPGDDGVVLFINQEDGQKFRAELPLYVDSRSSDLHRGIFDLFGREV